MALDDETIITQQARRRRISTERSRAAQRLRARRYYAKHKSRCAARMQAYHASTRAQCRERCQRWRKAHPEQTCEHNRQAYRNKSIEQRRTEKTRWRQANPERVRNNARKYYAANKEKVDNWGQQRAARQRQAARVDFTAAQWREMKAHYAHCCVYCGQPSQRLTMDHIMPLSLGGLHTVHNIVPACRSCNSRKKDGAVLVPVQPLLLTIAPARKTTR